MRINLRKAVLAIAGLTSCLSSNSAEISLACPGSIRIASGTIEAGSMLPGYRAEISKTPIQLSGINMFDGPPEQGAALKPDSEKFNPATKKTVSTWKFESDFQHGKFISCDYAYGMVRLSIQAPDSAGACFAETEKLKLRKGIKANFTCK